MIRGRLGTRSVAATGAALVLVASWLPWLHSADGFTLVNRLLALEPVIDGLPPRAFLMSWYLLPLTAIGVWLLAWLRPATARTLAVPALLLLTVWGVTILAVARSGDGALAGPVTAGAGVALVCGAWRAARKHTTGPTAEATA